jgi:GAF domain-containing protein
VNETTGEIQIGTLAAGDGEGKGVAYARLLQALEAVLPGAGDEVAVMATTACLLRETLPYASWAGFYRVVSPGLLRVGPYQGPLGCLEIPFARGVCGAAASTGETQLVPDVDAFPGHIACDSAARSELVVPVRGRDGALVAVLDLDSRRPAAFDEEDRAGVEAVAHLLERYL